MYGRETPREVAERVATVRAVVAGKAAERLAAEKVVVAWVVERVAAVRVMLAGGAKEAGGWAVEDPCPSATVYG